jgi:hypothetical protein
MHPIVENCFARPLHRLQPTIQRCSHHAVDGNAKFGLVKSCIAPTPTFGSATVHRVYIRYTCHDAIYVCHEPSHLLICHSIPNKSTPL